MCAWLKATATATATPSQAKQHHRTAQHSTPPFKSPRIQATHP
ncbi:MAG: hypothetical protein WCJ99_18200 [Betaproteobacteria bacterium]